jgi:hypothetical protein
MLSPARGGTRYGWHVEGAMNGALVSADFEVLVWSDIVRNSMDQGIAATYWQLARTAWNYISAGALFRLMRLRKGPVIAALYPVVFLLMQLMLALGWPLRSGSGLSGGGRPCSSHLVAGSRKPLSLRPMPVSQSG